MLALMTRHDCSKASSSRARRARVGRRTPAQRDRGGAPLRVSRRGGRTAASRDAPACGSGGTARTRKGVERGVDVLHHEFMAEPWARSTTGRTSWIQLPSRRRSVRSRARRGLRHRGVLPLGLLSSSLRELSRDIARVMPPVDCQSCVSSRTFAAQNAQRHRRP